MATTRQRNRRDEANHDTSEVKDNKKTTNILNDLNDFPIPDKDKYAKVKRRRQSPKSKKLNSFLDYLIIFIACGIGVLFLMLIWEVVIPTQTQRMWAGGFAVSLIPVFLVLKPSSSSSSENSENKKIT